MTMHAPSEIPSADITPRVLPPVSPNVDQSDTSDAYEDMYRRFQNGDVAAYAAEQCKQAQETRDGASETLTGEDLPYWNPGYGEPGDPDQTPSERDHMKVQPHASLSGAKTQESSVVK